MANDQKRANKVDWSIFKTLVNLPEDPKGSFEPMMLKEKAGREDCLRRVLRPHDDAGLQDSEKEVKRLRKALDIALDELTMCEIWRELRIDGFPAPPQYALDYLQILITSDAFLRYINAYLYFGIRFRPSTPRQKPPAPSCYDTNPVQFALEPPPCLPKDAESEARRDQLQIEWEKVKDDSDIEVALEFLDGFHPSDCAEELNGIEESAALELWLRGLNPEISGTASARRFEQIRHGLTVWATERSKFYLGLKPPKTGVTGAAPSEESAGAKGNSPPKGIEEFQVSEPVAARLALMDLYWIAKLLRAEVSSTGWVRYEKTNWLHLLKFGAILTCTRAQTELDHITPGEGNVAFDQGELEKRKAEVKTKQADVEALRNAEITLRSVFDLALDLVQNAVEVTNAPELESDLKERPPTTLSWRQTFDEELDEISDERRVRHFRDPTLSPQEEVDAARRPKAVDPENDIDRKKGWSRKVCGQPRPENLIGLAFSGGGIRSATLNLGVLQGLMEFDLLRHLDYISTVSGGGFIGSWLVGNVRRSAHWLGRKTDWSKSISHLHDYSNYLAPRTGILSADTWNMANSWLRNTVLIQLTGLAWLFFLLLASILGMRAFAFAGEPFWWKLSVADVTTAAMALSFVALVSFYLYGNSIARAGPSKGIFGGIETVVQWAGTGVQFLIESIRPKQQPHKSFDGHAISEGILDRFRRGSYVVRLAVVPAWIGGSAIASFLWFHAPLHAKEWVHLNGVRHYSELLLAAWCEWKTLLVAIAAGFAILSRYTLRRKLSLRRRIWLSALVSVACTGVSYLELAGIFYCFRVLSAQGDVARSVVYVIGPPMVLTAFAICILLLIGFTGRNSIEAQREWWTRFGTWLGIFAGLSAFVSSVALLGPWLILTLLNPNGHTAITKSIQWTSVLSWLGTVIGGTLAGKSGKTAGESQETSSPKLEILARVGGLLFIVGGFLLGSTLLYVLLFEIFGPNYAVIGSNALHIFCEVGIWQLAGSLASVFVIGWLFSLYFEVNIFGFSQFYRNRIVRCYLGATRWATKMRRPNDFTKFDFDDDIGLWRFRTDSPGRELPHEEVPVSKADSSRSESPSDKKSTSDQRKEPNCKEEDTPYRGPFPILCSTLNLAGSSDLALNTRHGASFTLTSLRCGSDRPRVGYAPTVHCVEEMDPDKTTDPDKRKYICGGYADGVQIGQAVAVSGAAVSPNMGYNTSPLVAFLLTMFNVRLGWWFPNPGRDKWKSRGLNFSLTYLLAELFGVADDTSSYVNVCDGGNFENLAIYELVRRRCRLIIACDAECDEAMQFGSLGKLIRLCEVDFGAVIDLDVKSIRPQNNGHSLAHCAVGLIKYCTGEIGYLIYLKASITGDEDVSIAQYRSAHPAFPHESTAEQFYSEDQFESYRLLGLHMVRKSFQGIAPGDDPLMAAERMYDVLAPAGPPSEKFLQHAQTLIDLWERFRNSDKLHKFMQELITVAQHETPANPVVSEDELCIGLEVIQLMENVFLDLRLDDFWEHPDNRGWAALFMRWARSPKLRRIWNTTHRTFGLRFEYFCSSRLGLIRDIPIARV